MGNLEVLVLASGSKGNAAVVRNTATGAGVLLDCGICKRDFMTRCDQFGFDPARLEAVFVTHEHGDHTKGLGVVLRGLAKMGVHPRLYSSDAVRKASKPVTEACEITDFRSFREGDSISAAGLQVHTFVTSHDSVESYGFRIECDGDALGWMTDTGIVMPQAHEALNGVRILGIESNHDVDMLRNGPYPWVLKERVGGDHGHLSNDQCVSEVESLLHSGLEQIACLHISENNNTYTQPVRALQEMLDRECHGAAVVSALQHGAIRCR